MKRCHHLFCDSWDEIFSLLNLAMSRWQFYCATSAACWQYKNFLLISFSRSFSICNMIFFTFWNWFSWKWVHSTWISHKASLINFVVRLLNILFLFISLSSETCSRPEAGFLYFCFIAYILFQIITTWFYFATNLIERIFQKLLF